MNPTPNNIPDEEPIEITAGDTVKWTRSLSPDYDDTWTLTYYLSGPQQTPITATASGSTFSVTITPAQSAAFNAGTYRLAGYVSKASERYPIYSGTLVVKADPAQAEAGVDARSDARQIADSILDVIKNRATRDEVEYLNALGVNVRKMTHKELQEAFMFWNGRAKSEERQALSDRGKRNGNLIVTRFNRPS